MTKKQIKFKIYQYECVDCGWKIWRDYIIDSPICSSCQSTRPPTIVEDELVKEVVINDTYTPEDYEQAKRIAQEIIEGKPLEEINGLILGIDENLRSIAKRSRMLGMNLMREFILKDISAGGGGYSWSLMPLFKSRRLKLPDEMSIKNNYY